MMKNENEKNKRREIKKLCKEIIVPRKEGVVLVDWFEALLFVIFVQNLCVCFSNE